MSSRQLSGYIAHLRQGERKGREGKEGEDMGFKGSKGEGRGGRPNQLCDLALLGGRAAVGSVPSILESSNKPHQLRDILLVLLEVLNLLNNRVTSGQTLEYGAKMPQNISIATK